MLLTIDYNLNNSFNKSMTNNYNIVLSSLEVYFNYNLEDIKYILIEDKNILFLSSKNYFKISFNDSNKEFVELEQIKFISSFIKLIVKKLETNKLSLLNEVLSVVYDFYLREIEDSLQYDYINNIDLFKKDSIKYILDDLTDNLFNNSFLNLIEILNILKCRGAL